MQDLIKDAPIVVMDLAALLDLERTVVHRQLSPLVMMEYARQDINRLHFRTSNSMPKTTAEMRRIVLEAV